MHWFHCVLQYKNDVSIVCRYTMTERCIRGIRQISNLFFTISLSNLLMKSKNILCARSNWLPLRYISMKLYLKYRDAIKLYQKSKKLLRLHSKMWRNLLQKSIWKWFANWNGNFPINKVHLNQFYHRKWKQFFLLLFSSIEKWFSINEIKKWRSSGIYAYVPSNRRSAISIVHALLFFLILNLPFYCTCIIMQL